MTKPTGNPRGRPAGAKNKRTMEVEAATQAAAEAIVSAIPHAFDGDAHTLLMAVYKDPDQPMPLRLDAAKAAVRYEKPALASIDMTSENTHRIFDVSDEPITLDEWEARHCRSGGDEPLN